MDRRCDSRRGRGKRGGAKGWYNLTPAPIDPTVRRTALLDTYVTSGHTCLIPSRVYIRSPKMRVTSSWGL